MKLRVNPDGLDPQRIAKARRDAGLSQLELAQKVGCSARTIQYWESEGTIIRRPHSRYVRRLAEATGKEISWLYGDEPVAA